MLLIPVDVYYISISQIAILYIPRGIRVSYTFPLEGTINTP